MCVLVLVCHADCHQWVGGTVVTQQRRRGLCRIPTMWKCKRGAHPSSEASLTSTSMFMYEENHVMERGKSAYLPTYRRYLLKQQYSVVVISQAEKVRSGFYPRGRNNFRQFLHGLLLQKFKPKCLLADFFHSTLRHFSEKPCLSFFLSLSLSLFLFFSLFRHPRHLES